MVKTSRVCAPHARSLDRPAGMDFEDVPDVPRWKFLTAKIEGAEKTRIRKKANELGFKSVQAFLIHCLNQCAPDLGLKIRSATPEPASD